MVMSWEIARDGVYTRCLIQNETKDTDPIITRFGRRQKCHITSGLATNLHTGPDPPVVSHCETYSPYAGKYCGL